MYCCSGILFNHESERRGETFVTRKITRAAGHIAVGLQDHLELGNLDSKWDWGYARDYVECMWKMLQQDKPDDYVIATGVQHTVREFTELAFAHDGIELEWRGEGMEEKGYDDNLVIETQPVDYIKKPQSYMQAVRFMLRKYPNMIKAMEERYIMYNEEKRYIREKELAGEVKVIRPDAPLNISPVEKDPAQLQRVYDHGREKALEFLSKQS